MKLHALFTWKTKLILVLVLLVLGGIGFYKVTNWFETHAFIWESPVSVHLQTPVYLVERAQAANIIVKEVTDNLPLNDKEKYLCKVFGDQCRKALQIQHLENGTEQCDRFVIEPNNTVSFGLMMINSVHLKKGYTIAQLTDCKTNIDIAMELYSKQGWGIWSTNKLVK